MLTAEKVIKEMYLLPLEERQKIARHIIEFGIRGPYPDAPEILDIKTWQDEIARKPFNLKQAAEYLGVSSVTLRRWVKAGQVLASKIGRAYTFDVRDLKELKKAHITK
jgi:excisionase family DNA binding protein